MWKRLFRKKRYFIVSYSFMNGNGFNTVTVKNGRYLNKKIYCEDMLNQLKDMNKDHEYGNVVINNIIELSKSDYENFIDENEDNIR
jgi:hypothetical protein